MGSVMKETQYINKSLSALGDVMEALDQKSKHIPYRFVDYIISHCDPPVKCEMNVLCPISFALACLTQELQTDVSTSGLTWWKLSNNDDRHSLPN